MKNITDKMRIDWIQNQSKDKSRGVVWWTGRQFVAYDGKYDLYGSECKAKTVRLAIDKAIRANK